MKYCVIFLVIGLLISNKIFSQSLTEAQKTFLKRNSKTIYLDSLKNQPNWAPLISKIKNKKLILLGEFNHGSKEIFELRNSLIKHLHKEAGAKVILLESGIGEIAFADINRDTLTASQMTNGLVGPWRTKEFEALMDYVKSQNIAISGFDVQKTGGSFVYLLNHVAQKYRLDSVDVYSLESRYGAITKELTNKKAVYDSLKVKTSTLTHDYQAVQEKISDIITGSTSKDLLFTEITLKNRITYLTYMLQFLEDKNWNKRWAARDLTMANNILWLIDNIYRGQQVIIIGHNFHIGKYNENETVMGEVLKAKYDKEMYSIGVFAGSGAYSDNFGKTVEMTSPDSAEFDIKHVIAELHGAANFIDIPDRFSNGSDWLDNDVIINDTFIDLSNSNKMNLSKTFDGLILLRVVSPPK